VWNAIRFSQMQLGADFTPNKKAGLSGKELGVDRWILSRLAVCVQQCTLGFHNYDFPQITTAIYNFWLYELCDVYLEVVKPVSFKIFKRLY
jgi:valyl-tRNA synthetase